MPTHQILESLPAPEERTGGTPGFENHATAALARIRSALADLLHSVDASPLRPQEVARKFNLNKNLTWRISKVIREPDPAAAAPHIPGKAGLAIFLDSLKKAGAPAAAILEVNQAINEFDRMREIHAGDRETLEAMLGHLANGAEAQQQIEAQRKLSFRGNSAIWGVQARVQICTNFIAPSADPDFADLAWLSGLVDLRRLRRDTTWAIASTRKVDDRGQALPVGQLESIDERFRGDATAPLMGEFCSDPLPEIRLEVGADGLMRYLLVGGPLGNTAAQTCIVGICGRRFLARHQVPGDTIGEHIARLYTPVECLIHDLYVHRELSYALHPEVFLYSQLPINPVYPMGGRETAQLPLLERIQSLGHAPPTPLTPELPQYPSLVRRVFERMGWNARDFHGFRLTLRYPPIPAVAVFRYPLAIKGE